MKIDTTFTMKREFNTYISQLCLIKQDYNTLLQTSVRYLHHKEIKILNQLPSLSRKHNYLLGRIAAKQALKEIWPQNLTEVHIANGIFEQPVFKSICANLGISISHSKDVGVALLFPEEHPMAIDIEHIDSCSHTALSMHLVPSELEYVNKYIELPMCVLLWTAREALAKVLKTGMMVSLDVLSIDKISICNNIIISTYKNFYQYKALSVLLDGDLILTITCPKNTNLDLTGFICKSKKEALKHDS